MKTHTAAEAAQLAHTDPRTLERIELIDRCVGLCTAQMERAERKRHALHAQRRSVKHDHSPSEAKARYYARSDSDIREVEADYRCYRRLRALAQTEQRVLFPQQPPEHLEDATWIIHVIESMDPNANIVRRPTNGD